MLETVPALPSPERAALVRLGRHLRAVGYTERPVSQALGVLAWDSRALDGAWWQRGNRAEGDLAVLIDLLIRGAALPVKQVQRVLPADAWRARLVQERRGDAWVDGILLPLAGDLLWTDRATRSFEKGGLFLPDSSSLALRRTLPPGRCRRHLDLGAGAGSVTVAAARRAEQIIAVDLAPRFGEAVQRCLALNDLPPPLPFLGRAEEVHALEPVDRVSFVLPLLVSWEGMAEIGPIHTIGGQPGLLRQTLEVLARVLAPGGVATLYTQDWTPGSSLLDTIAASFRDRAWRAAYWWDTEGRYRDQVVHTGVLAIQADAKPGWRVARNTAPDLGAQDWWPHLEALLAGAPPPSTARPRPPEAAPA